MPLSWNEIKSRSITFSKEWEGETRERAEKDTFWNEFLNIFGISRRRVATFEKAVKKLNENQGYIDLFWPGTLLVEHKSAGKDLDSAFSQALDYFPGLKEHELPRYIITSDFTQFKVYDLDKSQEHFFSLSDLTKNIHLFGFVAGYEKKTFKEEDPVNIDAAYLMGRLHDRLEEVGYKDHDLEVYLVRILFCLFAEDTNIFEKGIFQEYIELHTKEDGSDLAIHLAHIFQTLNTRKEERLTNLDEALDQFPYVNGQLFSESLKLASFDSGMRDMLLDACGLGWGKISPAIFGSMFQAAMNQEERRNLGAHYTSEKNIQKLIKPLFLDELHKEFKKAKGSTKKLKELHEKIASLKFLDPACGCGNFLIITYRELRELEIQILRELNKKGLGYLNIGDIIKVDIDQFYGIEYDEFPVRIAEVAMWLIDHQMNMKVSEEFGQYFVRLPLKKSATILHGNALKTDWKNLISNNELSFILGNPPFYGSKLQSEEQRQDLEEVFGSDVKDAKIMDYVSAWYIKAARYIQDTGITVGYVSTNSITQGEQVGVLWTELLEKYNVEIHFAHKTFKWTNQAKGKAGVYCVIIGFGQDKVKQKTLFEYQEVTGEPHSVVASNINPYLVDAQNVLIRKRTTPLTKVPPMSFGNMPLDGGNLLLSNEEKEKILEKEPALSPYIKPLISAREFLNGQNRWCIWLKDESPKVIKTSSFLLERIKAVKEFRLSSRAASTRKHAETPWLFRDKSNPESFIVIPSTTSENREYIPFGIFDKNYIANNSCHIIPNANLFLFGVLSSQMHLAWVKYVCGRLESRIRYSKNIVYNNYPFPVNATRPNQSKVEKSAQKLLDARMKFSESSLSDLYDPLIMPKSLRKAHTELNKAVDLCYRPQPFPDERRRMEFLFELYNSYIKNKKELVV
ncbi:class I SAM-dependent DNA methyltransferase [Salegentibacter salarius]|uniref:site-specific DNA-methyltransferase (adenine-specific) n=1 Tax=Salegentibacter salarius TaxID=435906 RepID=A0A2N0TRM4_9FLAO|nr:DNA methyltransferase [Salegentibacter salarius]OEY71753.1 methylase [Salegentibacter salarius]PKD17346.1 methylase [Salegentibacter salarius]SLJ89451.1 Methyltransferase domain-containing protein [Salegentibacter salarius]